MMNPDVRMVAMTGASGLIGRHLRLELVDQPVTLLGRRRLDPGSNETWRAFDLSASVDLSFLPPGSSLCHMAYAMTEGEANVDYTYRAIEAVNRSDSIDHVVMLSSASVYGAGVSGDIDEQTPLRPDSDYARTKARCDLAWLDLLRPNCRLTILRPTSVVADEGPGLQALVDDALHHPVKSIAKRFLQHSNSVHFIAIDNVVAAIAFALDNQGPSRDLFIVADDDASENESYAAMQDHVRALLGRSPLHVPPLPRLLERPIGRALGKPLGMRRRFSSRSIREAGYIPRITLADMLRRSLGE